jgi:twinkle protein
LLGQLSLDFAEQGISTLWGSFEIKNTRLIHKMLQQFAREPLPIGGFGYQSKLEEIANNFESLPLYFLKFHGGSDIDEVMGAMDYATYVHDVQHIILDNMQFMISRKSTNSSFDKFDVQDMAVEKFRKFATEKNVHVTLVVHPRKENEGARLDISSIYGSAKATQEADLVLILQNDGRRKFVEVKKNRYDGTLGLCPLFFERQSGRYMETPPAGTPQGTSGQVKARPIHPRPVMLAPRPRSQPMPDEDIDDHWNVLLPTV